MDKENEKKGPHTEFTEHQSAMDQALNEQLRSEKGDKKLDERDIRRQKVMRKPDVDEKKTGRSKSNT